MLSYSHTGPGSSDSSQELSPHEGAGARTYEGSDSEELYEDVRSVTPHPPNMSASQGDISMETSIPSETISNHNLDYVGDVNTPPLLQMSSKDSIHSNSDENFQGSNETSDTDFRDNQWKNRRFESDLSTAPFSSETSDMDTSGNERILAANNGSVGQQISQSKPPSQIQHRQINSESSGDEIAKRARDVRIVPRPPPKPVILQVLTRGPPPAKKPSNLTKNSSTASKLSVTSLHTQSKTSNVPSRNRGSVKGGIPAKPKPPVAAKPKPDVKPKPVLVAAQSKTATDGGLSNGLYWEGRGLE